jgi:aspartyl aminopeptidase
MKSGLAGDMVDFINTAWTPYHCVEEASKRLLKAGYEHISEKGAWDVQPGGKYFFTRNYSTIVAFAVGEKFQPGACAGGALRLHPRIRAHARDLI